MVQYPDGRAYCSWHLPCLSTFYVIFSNRNDCRLSSLGHLCNSKKTISQDYAQHPLRLQHAHLSHHPIDIPRLQKSQLQRSEQTFPVAFYAHRGLRFAYYLPDL